MIPQIPNSTALENFFAGLPGRGNQLIGNPLLQTVSKWYGGFFQDDWRIKPRLMLNLGLRYNYATPLHEDNNQLGSFNPKLGLVQQGQWRPTRARSPRLERLQLRLRVPHA